MSGFFPDPIQHTPKSHGPDFDIEKDEDFEALLRQDYADNGGAAKYAEWRDLLKRMPFAQKMDALARMPYEVMSGFLVAMAIEGDL
jgi:hypothetical protein